MRLQHADHREADRPAADDDRDVALAHLAAADGVPADGHRLGERGNIGRQAVGYFEGQRLLDEKLLGVGARRGRGETGGVNVLAATQQWHRDDRRAGSWVLARSWAEIDYLAAEFVPHHNLLVRPHGVVVADFRRRVCELIAVMAGVQV